MNPESAKPIVRTVGNPVAGGHPFLTAFLCPVSTTASVLFRRVFVTFSDAFSGRTRAGSCNRGDPLLAAVPAAVPVRPVFTRARC